MKVFFKDLRWNKGSQKLVQGVRGNCVPYNAIAGGNGTFICTTPSELILTVTTTDGREVSKNIISVVRAVNCWSRITQSRFDVLKTILKDTHEFELDENGYIIDLENYICV